MPKYLDHHATLPTLPPQVIQQMTHRVKAGKKDQVGVKPLNVFLSTAGPGVVPDGDPSMDAVCQSHEAMGITLAPEDVHEVQSLV